MFGTPVSDMQSDVVVSGNAITGTLKYLDDYTGFSSKESEQSGNYLALTLSNNDFSNLTSVKIGLRPTYKTGVAVDNDSGLVEIINDPDKNIVLKINDASTQKVKIVSQNRTNTNTQVFNLSGLICQQL